MKMDTHVKTLQLCLIFWFSQHLAITVCLYIGLDIVPKDGTSFKLFKVLVFIVRLSSFQTQEKGI